MEHSSGRLERERERAFGHTWRHTFAGRVTCVPGPDQYIAQCIGILQTFAYNTHTHIMIQ